MKIYSLNFSDNQYYKRMFNVLKQSCKRYMPQISFNEIHPIDYSFNNIHDKETQYWKNNNIIKMLSWAACFNDLKNGEEVVFLDGDIFIKSDFSEVFNQEFDIAYTIDQLGDFPEYIEINELHSINTGVMFFRVNERTKKFFSYWKNICIEMYNDPIFLEKWMVKSYGLTQPSFLYSLENINIKELRLPRFIYNCPPIDNFKNMKICHIQEPFWKIMLYSEDELKNMNLPEMELNQKIVDLWRELENEYNNSLF